MLKILTALALLFVQQAKAIDAPPALIGRTNQGRACRLVYTGPDDGVVGMNLLLYSPRAKWEVVATFHSKSVGSQVRLFEAACRVLKRKKLEITAELHDGQWLQVAKLRCESEDGLRFFEAAFEYQRDILRPIRVHRRSNVDDPNSVTCDFTPFWRALRHLD